MPHALSSKQCTQTTQDAKRIVLFYKGHEGEIMELYERQFCHPLVLSSLLHSKYRGSITISASNGKMQQPLQSFILLSNDRN